MRMTKAKNLRERCVDGVESPKLIATPASTQHSIRATSRAGSRTPYRRAASCSSCRAGISTVAAQTTAAASHRSRRNPTELSRPSAGSHMVRTLPPCRHRHTAFVLCSPTSWPGRPRSPCSSSAGLWRADSCRSRAVRRRNRLVMSSLHRCGACCAKCWQAAVALRLQPKPVQQIGTTAFSIDFRLARAAGGLQRLQAQRVRPNAAAC